MCCAEHLKNRGLVRMYRTMHIVKAIDEMYGGYSLDILTGQKENDSMSGGGLSDSLSDLYIPLGLYYQNERAEFTFYKPQKASIVDEKLFEYLFNAVSKTKSKPTRKQTAQPDHKTRKRAL